MKKRSHPLTVAELQPFADLLNAGVPLETAAKQLGWSVACGYYRANAMDRLGMKVNRRGHRPEGRDVEDGPRCEHCRLLLPCLDCPRRRGVEAFTGGGAGDIYPETFAK